MQQVPQQSYLRLASPLIMNVTVTYIDLHLLNYQCVCVCFHNKEDVTHEWMVTRVSALIMQTYIEFVITILKCGSNLRTDTVKHCARIRPIDRLQNILFLCITVTQQKS